MVAERHPYRFFFFGFDAGLWLQKNIIIDSISFDRVQEREGRSTGRIIS